MTGQRIHPCAFRSTQELEPLIKDYLAVYDQAPKSSIWHKNCR